MKKILLPIIILYSIVLSAQNYSHQGYVISNGGGLIFGDEYENFFVLGEPIVTSEISGGTYSGAIGFLTIIDTITSVEDENIIPEKFYLKQNYPNPFNPETTIAFNLPNKSKVCLEIFNIKGQKVITLINEEKETGFHKIIWNGRDSNNRKVSSGVYFYRIITEKNEKIKKMILIK